MVEIKVHLEGLDALADRLPLSCSQAEHVLAQQVAKDTSPFVPALTGSLDQRTRVEENKVIYPGPYSRFLNGGMVMIDPQTGSTYASLGATKVLTDRNLVFNTAMHAQAQDHWFEASKAQNLEKWERVAGKAVEHEL